MDKKNIIIFLVFILIIVLAGAYSFVKIYLAEQEEENQQQQIIGGDQDEHGCMLMAGYSWCDAEQKCIRPWEEGCEDYITQLFTTIDIGSNVDFSEVSDVELVWQVESEEGVEELNLQALMINADEVNNQRFQKIEGIIKENGFENDKYNVRDGILGEFGSYRKDSLSLVCTLIGIYSDFDPDDKLYEPKTTDKNVKIICAILDK